MCSAYHNDADTITAIVDQLASPLVASLLDIHPNDVTLGGEEFFLAWSPWWTWAEEHTRTQPGWLQLIRYYTRSAEDDDAAYADIPPQLRTLVDAVRTLQLNRTPSAYESTTRKAGDHAYRMSPKKVHEVECMSAYIRHLVHTENPRTVWHAVDVGSGQGYLSRALSELDFDVLALDNDEHQTSGANRWPAEEVARKFIGKHRSQEQTPSGTRGSLTHRTVHVRPETLDGAISDWLKSCPGSERRDDSSVQRLPTPQEPVPVLMVALHACGSLTVDVLRTFLSNRAREPNGGEERVWTPHSLVVVGCCYNLMSHSDFPLSKRLRELDPVPRLTIAARHLAAQVPSQWLRDSRALQSAQLALRKVVYRALLQPLLQAAVTQSVAITDRASLSERPIQPGLGETLENRRLGKLHDKAYQDWPTFLERATDKLGIDLAAITTSLPNWFAHEVARLRMESALLVLQTLRCIVGPMIETFILLDRRDWIKDAIAEMTDCGQEVDVEMVNLFNQATGSGRNVALVIKHATTPHKVCPVIERV